jgi:hypothetical protein
MHLDKNTKSLRRDVINSPLQEENITKTQMNQVVPIPRKDIGLNHKGFKSFMKPFFFDFNHHQMRTLTLSRISLIDKTF